MSEDVFTSYAKFVADAGACRDDDSGALELTTRLLDHTEEGGGRSSLNNDGAPIQVCASLDARGPRWRLIVDPASTVEPAERRFLRARASLERLLAERGPALAPPCEQTLEATLPRDPSGRAKLATGCLWLAAGLSEPGLALYTTARWGDVDARWSRVDDWLERVLPDASRAREALAAVRPVALPIAQAIEGDSPERARAKVYFRAQNLTPLAKMGVGLLVDARVVEFLTAVVGDARLGRDTLVFSLGFSLRDGSVADAKVDVCAHCVVRHPEEWIAVFDAWALRWSTPPFGVEAALRAGRAEVAFVGLGVRTDGEVRTNLYLKPPSSRR